jgi:hypothetical protein
MFQIRSKSLKIIKIIGQYGMNEQVGPDKQVLNAFLQGLDNQSILHDAKWNSLGIVSGVV